MLRSVLMLAASVFVTAFLSVLAVIFSIFSPSGKQSRRVARLWARTVLRVTGTRVKVIGRENIIKEKPHLFMANHQSDFDIPIVFAAIPVDFLWTVKKELFSVPVFGRALKKAGYIEIDRNNPAKAMNGLHGAAEKLRSGMSIATFPEGTRSGDGKLLPFDVPSFVEGETNKAYMRHINYSWPTLTYNLHVLLEDMVLALVFRGVRNLHELHAVKPTPLRRITTFGEFQRNTH